MNPQAFPVHQQLYLGQPLKFFEQIKKEGFYGDLRPASSPNRPSGPGYGRLKCINFCRTAEVGKWPGF